MSFVFKNPDFGKWVYQFFSKFDVQEQIKKQWDNHSEGLEINASSHSGVCVPVYPFSNVDAILLFSKNEVMPSQEYVPNRWNPYPQVIPPVAGSYLVSVKSDEGTIETEVDRYFPGEDSWVWNEPHEILAFKAVPAPYNPKEGETK